MIPSLFPNLVLGSPQTEGIKYAGSKLRLLPHILQLAKKVNVHKVFDGFAGTTRVSQAFAQLGYQVVLNDIAVWSKTFGLCYLKNQKPKQYYQEIVDHLNSLKGKDGWFSENYGGFANGKMSSHLNGLKKPWQVHNTQKLDAIREEIDQMNLGEIEKSVLLTSLILALDQVDSTLGHYASYLNDWSPRSYNTMKLTVPNLLYLWVLKVGIVWNKNRLSRILSQISLKERIHERLNRLYHEIFLGRYYYDLVCPY